MLTQCLRPNLLCSFQVLFLDSRMEQEKSYCAANVFALQGLDHRVGTFVQRASIGKVAPRILLRCNTGDLSSLWLVIVTREQILCSHMDSHDSQLMGAYNQEGDRDPCDFHQCVYLLQDS